MQKRNCGKKSISEFSLGKLHPIAGIWCGLSFLCLYYVVSAVVAYIYEKAAYLILNDTELINKALRNGICARLLISAVVTFFVSVILFKFLSVDFKEFCAFKKTNAIYFVSAFFAGIFLNDVISALLEIITVPDSWNESHDESVSLLFGGDIALMLFVVIISTPFIEEFLFRGVMFSFIEKSWCIPGAFIVSSLVFGIIHGNILQAIYTFIAGMLFAYYRYKSKSLWSAYFAHVGFNSYSFLTMLMGETEAWMRLAVGAAALILIITGHEFVFKSRTDCEKELK